MAADTQSRLWERFFGLPQGVLRPMKPGEKLTYDRKTSLPKQDGKSSG